MKKNHFLTFSFLLILSFTQAQENKVLYEVLPLIINSILDREITSIPPPPITIEKLKESNFFDKSEPENVTKAIENWKNSIDYQKEKKKWIEKMKKSVPEIYEGELIIHEIVDSVNNTDGILKTQSPKNSFKIKLKDLNTNEIKIKVKIISEFLELKKIRKKHPENKIIGMMSFNDFEINLDETFGTIRVSFLKHRLGGYGLKVHFKKKKKSGL
ncbi:hypothetical protein [Wenyingzhuangia sp. 2_MG-2023]|uniref:hypothetical protein n=1 Tax=Wenyingzhuangia sp. 2_MG-2023 TaxID=3062639 RepID=UPI0026E33BA8|nr:hypothetical protein [Wenyingzhuangia sp. 2_MG-2023]MDO6739394.1 hypothetical protein [Wenyingzhuangia sp. 2_MG-2023]